MNYAIDPQDIYQLIHQDVLLIDIRDTYQFNQLHIQNFINIPLHQFNTQNLPYNKPIYLICTNGIHAKNMALDLRKKGFQTYYIEGGFKAFLATQQHPKYF